MKRDTANKRPAKRAGCNHTALLQMHVPLQTVRYKMGHTDMHIADL